MATPRSRAPFAVRYADLAVLAGALAVFVAGGLPMIGYGVAACAWLAQRALHSFAERRAQRALAAGDRRIAMGTVGAATLGRVWIVTLPILLVGLLAEREDGLAAAVLSGILVTVFFTSQGLARLFE